MKTIGIKLADGSFYPVLEDNSASAKNLDLTTAHNNQTKVMVDLYRSATCTMEDAEYVDSLQIENLIAHPNGEPDITFTVSIDENNKLSAKIVDTETGNQSKTTITLVSRTQEERLITDEYNIADSDKKKSETVKRAGGLLAAASALREKENQTQVEFTPAADMEMDFTEEAETEAFEETEKIEDSDLELPAEEPVIVDQSMDEEPVFDETAVEEQVAEDIDASVDIPVVEDPIVDPTMDEEPVVEEINIPAIEESAAENDISDNTGFDLDLPDFPEETITTEDSNPFDIPETSEETEEIETPVIQEPAPEEAISDDTGFDLDLPDFSEETITTEDSNPFDIPETSEETEEAEEKIEEPVFEIEEKDEDAFGITEETAESSDFSLDLDLPDFEDTSIDANDDISADDPFALPEDKLASTVEDFPTFESEDTVSEPIIEENTADNFSLDDDLDLSFDIPEDQSTTEDSLQNDFSDDFFNMDDEKTDNDAVPAGKGLSFTGLYDKETELGTSSSFEEDSKQKTKAPVIICIICAIICILATAAVLFIIPSKYNLLNKAEKEDTVILSPVQETPAPVVEPEPEPIPEPEPEPIPEPVPEAKEEEIVVIEKAEEVVPEQPPVAEEKPKDISYKIKWGDTLWDIADTYYKNPWRYKYIARYNKIKNPDYIISGTYITIPAE